MIPLPAQTVAHMWKSLLSYDFKSTHGAFAGMDVRDPNVKNRVRESAQIQISAMRGAAGNHTKVLNSLHVEDKNVGL